MSLESKYWPDIPITLISYGHILYFIFEIALNLKFLKKIQSGETLSQSIDDSNFVRFLLFILFFIVYKDIYQQELQEVLKFPIEIFWNLEARNFK